MGTALRAFALACCFLSLLIPMRAVEPADTLEELQQRFDRETDGVSKAKMLRKLGDAQFAKEREAAKANDYDTVDVVMEKYRDNVRAAFDAVKKAHPDAERHPAGYKQLEIHIESGIREVNDLLVNVPEPYRPPLQIVKTDLLAMDNELLHMLFPRRPGEKPLPPKTDATTKPLAEEKKP
jgi:hypothetical protein